MGWSSTEIWNRDKTTGELELAADIENMGNGNFDAVADANDESSEESSSLQLDITRSRVVDNDNSNAIHKNSDMKSVLKERYTNLPSAPWPQLNHGTSEAIVNGHMVGFDATMPPSSFNNQHSNTIVTAYYEFESKHGVGQYENWFKRILRSSEPMIIFVEPGSRWGDFVKEQRTHAPTIVAQLAFEELVMSTTFTENFWDFMFSIDSEASVHKGSSVYKIWNEKLVSWLWKYC